MLRQSALYREEGKALRAGISQFSEGVEAKVAAFIVGSLKKTADMEFKVACTCS